MNTMAEKDQVQTQGAGVVGVSHIHESAHLHVTGAATYIDDIPELAGTLHMAIGMSPVAHGKIRKLSLDVIRAMPGVVDVYSAEAVPGLNDVGAIVKDDPVLTNDLVQYIGQPVFAVVAETREAARRAAAMAKQVIEIDPLPAVLNAREAHKLEQYVASPMHMTRGDAQKAIAAAPNKLNGSFATGGQEQFYLEGQIAYVLPQDDGGLTIHCSSQSISEVQLSVSHVMDMPAHKIRVECRRLGGGFGGKETEPNLIASITAIAAQRCKRPVKLRLDRDDDFLITGRRHGFDFDYEVGYDNDGRILGLEITLISNGGFSCDLSPPVMIRAMCNVDGSYWIPDVAIHAFMAKTNTQSNTAFRGFGGPQGAMSIESIIETIASKLKRDPLEIRRINFYGTTERNVTPYGQTIEDNILHELVDELVETSDYHRRRKEIAAFNAKSPILKRGLAISPLKFGISFHVTFFNQAGALVHVYQDGSILVNHGGIEMGQGLNTKIAQIVAHELGVDLSSVRCTATDTQKIPNSSPTAASTGCDLNGKAAQDAARKIRERLASIAAQCFNVPAEYVHFGNGQVRTTAHRSQSSPKSVPVYVEGGTDSANVQSMSFKELVAEAYMGRVQLWSDGFYKTPLVNWDWGPLQGRPFFYYTYGAAVSEVIVDTLTGESRLLRADLLHNTGRSLNPAIDIGQIEGAFIQGMGWLTTEEVVWNKDGLLTTHSPSTYKIPTANDCPPVFNVKLFERDNLMNTIHRSKAVGEPPLLLPFSVFFAIRDAVSSLGAPGVAPVLRAPATAEAVLDAVRAVRLASSDKT